MSRWQEFVERSAKADCAIPRGYENVSWESCTLLPSDLVEWGKRWVEAPQKPSLFLTGITGCGKTQFSIALLRGIVEKGHSWTRFMKSVKFFDVLLNDSMTYKTNTATINKFSETEFFFLDDVGVESDDSDRIKKEYFTFIDNRLNDMLPTIFTSNLSRDEFTKRVGDRVKSRMHQYFEISFPNTDLRKQIEPYRIR